MKFFSLVTVEGEFDTNLAEIDTYGQDMAIQRSIEMAINVFTDADTDTPCMYDTVLQIKVPSVHSEIAQWEKEIFKFLFKLVLHFKITLHR